MLSFVHQLKVNNLLIAFLKGIDEKTMFPYVGNVVVDQSYRRKGIALSLMNQALASTKSWGGAFAFCAVHTENEAASDLYLNKLGFRIFRLEKADDNFFNPDKRSRYILVKEFPIETTAESEGASDAAEGDDTEKNFDNKLTLNINQENLGLDIRADRNIVVLGGADIWGNSLGRLVRIDYSDLVTNNENSSHTESEIDLTLETAERIL